MSPSDAGAHAGRDRPLRGIFCKVTAHLMFVVMFAAVRWLGPDVPTGQIVFWRSTVGMAVIVAMALVTGGPQLLKTNRIDAHARRSISGVMSMFCNFTAFALLPIAEATTLGFAQPLFLVVLAALILHERVYVYRWSAVVVGFIGVLIVVGPYFDLSEAERLLGALLAIAGAALSAVAMIFLRRMSSHEHSLTIAFYFMVTTTAVSAVTIFWGWKMLTAPEIAALVLCGCAGGIGQIFLSFSYRYAEVSALAPFDYTALIWAAAIGYLFFGELPMLQAWIGAAIIVVAGLFIIWREHRLGRTRPPADAL
jgi:drug/metabolite transporter (DMT)-like permease